MYILLLVLGFIALPIGIYIADKFAALTNFTDDNEDIGS